MENKNLLLLAIVPLISFGMIGCTTVTSQSISKNDTSNKGENNGIAYFLPRQLAEITVTRSNSKVDSAIENVAKAKTNLAAANAQLLIEDQAVQAARDKLAAAETAEGQRLGREELNNALVKQRV